MLATIGFFALAIFGLGALTVATDVDIIAISGLGQLPGAIGMLVGLGAFAATLWVSIRRGRPSFSSVVVIALATALAHLVTVWLGVLVASGDPIVALVVAGALVRGGASVVLLLAAAVAGWAGIALRRTRARRPQWPWERDDDE